MKRTLTLVAALALVVSAKTFAGTASAAKTSTGTPDKTSVTMSKSVTIEDRVKKLQDKLSLTPDQVSKVTAIYQNSRVQAITDKLRDTNLDKTARHNAMMDMKTEMESVNKQIEPILTDAQKVEFKKMQAGQGKPAAQKPTTTSAKPSGK